MSAKHALLGLLLDRPGYPYELGERLQRRLGPAWSVNSGQLYQNVEWLKTHGLIERIDDEPTREGRHVYAITPDGVAAFETWLDEASDSPRRTRRPVLAKVTLAGPTRVRQTLEQIEAYRRERADLLADLMRQEAAAHDQTQARADQVFLRLNLSADILTLQAELQWARRAREEVLRLIENDTVWPGSHEPRHDPTAGARHARARLFSRMSSRPLGAAGTEPDTSTPEPEGPRLVGEPQTDGHPALNEGAG
jgi:DNA-binding PadR family transcriptional regulator